MGLPASAPDYKNEPSHRGGRTIACLGCSAAFVLVLLAGILVFAIAVREGGLPEPFKAISNMSGCQENMREILGALERYEFKNGKYPEKLEEIYPDFLRSKKVLHCPASTESERKKATSYVYHKPPPDAKSDFIIIECKLHKSANVLSLQEGRLSGEVTVRISEQSAPVAKPQPKGN